MAARSFSSSFRGTISRDDVVVAGKIDTLINEFLGPLDRAPSRQVIGTPGTNIYEAQQQSSEIVAAALQSKDADAEIRSKDDASELPLCTICFVALQVEPAEALACGHAFHQSCLRRNMEVKGITRIADLRCPRPDEGPRPLQRTATEHSRAGSGHSTAQSRMDPDIRLQKSMTPAAVPCKTHHSRTPDVGIGIRVFMPSLPAMTEYYGEYLGHGHAKTAFELHCPGERFHGQYHGHAQVLESLRRGIGHECRNREDVETSPMPQAVPS